LEAESKNDLEQSLNVEKWGGGKAAANWQSKSCRDNLLAQIYQENPHIINTLSLS
jgi:hypothetical protein